MCTLNKNIFYFHLNHNYLLTGCVHLLGTAQLLKPWEQVGQDHPNFLFHADFGTVLGFLSQSRKVSHVTCLRNMAPSIVEIANNLGQVVTDFVCLENLECKIPYRHPRWTEFTVGLWGTSVHSMRTTGLDNRAVSVFHFLILINILLLCKRSPCLGTYTWECLWVKIHICYLLSNDSRGKTCG